MPNIKEIYIYLLIYLCSNPMKLVQLSHFMDGKQRFSNCPQSQTINKWQRLGFKNRQLGSGASQVVLVVKILPANAGDRRDGGSIPGLGRSPWEGNCNPFQYSCLEKHRGQSSLVGWTQYMGSSRVGHDLVTEWQQQLGSRSMKCIYDFPKKLVPPFTLPNTSSQMPGTLQIDIEISF